MGHSVLLVHFFTNRVVLTSFKNALDSGIGLSVMGGGGPGSDCSVK